MLCDNCRKNEATNTFIASWMGKQHEIHVCQECLEQMWNYAGMTGQRKVFAAISGWWPGKEDPRQGGDNPFPQDAGLYLKTKRKMAALQARLEESVQEEDYEEAARLRDSIAAMQRSQEVCSSES